jgi:hypothetical protein
VQLPYAMLNPAKQDLRQQQSRPLLGVIQKQIEAARSAALPGGSLARCGLRRMEPLRFQAGAKLAKEKGVRIPPPRSVLKPLTNIPAARKLAAKRVAGCARYATFQS